MRRLVVLVVPVLLAACSAGAGPTTGPSTPAATSGTGTATSTPAAPATSGSSSSPTSAATEPAESTDPATDAPATDGAATTAANLGDLESLIPTEIAGNAMTIEPASDPARSFEILWNDEQVAQDLLDSLDAASSEIDVVFSYPTGDTFPDRVSVDAYQVAGADGTALRDGMVEKYREYFETQANVDVEITEEMVSGKEALLLTVPNAPPGEGSYYYSVGDTVFVVSGTPIEWVEDAFAQLP